MNPTPLLTTQNIDGNTEQHKPPPTLAKQTQELRAGVQELHAMSLRIYASIFNTRDIAHEPGASGDSSYTNNLGAIVEDISASLAATNVVLQRIDRELSYSEPTPSEPTP